jgi:hypothetical protein
MVLLVLVALGAGVARGEEHTAQPAADAAKDWSLTLDATFNGKYIWRGINLVDDPVFQPSVAFSYRGLTASVWGNMELTNTNTFPGHGDTAGDFTEVDYILDYSWAWRGVNLSAGAIYYDFPNTSAPSTTELYGVVALDVLLAPSVTLYQDIDEADGTYVNFALGHTFEDVWQPSETVSMSVDLSGSVGLGSANFNSFYYGVDQTAFTDVLVSLGLPLEIGERWTVTPSLNYSSLLDDDIRGGMSNDGNLWFGTSLAFTF